MDPNQTLSDMLDAIDDGDFELAAECQENLLEWLRKGGFAPVITDVQCLKIRAASAAIDSYCPEAAHG